MYFDTYQECLEAAIKQSKGKLGDCKLYVNSTKTINPISQLDLVKYKITFTRQSATEYVYNGEVKQVETEGE